MCEKHGLVAARDGRCVLCRRTGVSWMHRKERTLADQVVTALLLLGLIAASVLLLGALRRPANRGDAPSVAAASVEAAPEPATAMPQPDPVADATEAETVDAGSPTKRMQRRRMAEARRNAIRRARRHVSVQMYSTDWCLICDEARFYLQATDVDFEELRIDLDGEAAERLAELNETRSVPTFMVDDEVLVGYNPYLLERVIDARASDAANLPERAASDAAP